MRARIQGLLLVAVIAGGASGCATSEQWADWKGHSSHFASDQHLTFSVRNPEGAAPKVRQSDMTSSRNQSWWGNVVSVNADQIFQN
jgi:hypothetical protein